MIKPKYALPPKAPSATPKRPSGQFQSQRETTGKMNGGGHGEAVHPASHSAWEKL